MKVLIITEGSSKIGFGHVTRCMSLYQAFMEKGATVRFIVNGDSKIESILKNTNYEVFNWLEDPDRLFKLLKEYDLTVIDSYLADESFYQKLSKSVPLAAYIDDNNRINYPEGIMINGSILAEKINYPQSEGVHYLLGSQYIPLRREFWSVPEKTVKTDVKNIMLTFGGDDLRNLTPDMLKLLISHCPDMNKKIVIGNGFKNISEIEDLKDDNTELIYYPDAQGMLKTMFESDIAISAGGQTLYELAKVGLPSLAIGVAHNQAHNVENWEKVGFMDFAGFWDAEYLNKSVLEKLDLLMDKEIRIKRCKIGRKFVDGKGALRIAKICLNEYYAENTKLRAAEARDVKNVYRLSSDDEVRKNSFNTDKIEFAHHKKWFKDKLEDPDTMFLVAQSPTDFIGQVRFDLEENEATISISINSKFRGLGLGSIIIEKSIEHIKENLTHIEIIKAYIKESNEKSINLFKKMNFKNRENFWIENQDALLYIYKIRD